MAPAIYCANTGKSRLMPRLIPSMVVFLCVLSGCSAPTPEPKWVEDTAAPLATADIKSFVPGKWAIKLGDLDPAFAKQLGVGELAEQQSEMEGDQFYTFAEDGTYTYTEAGKKWVFAGRWTVVPSGVALSIDTLDGVPIQAKMAELDKEAQGGGQASVGRDLFFDQKLEELQKHMEISVRPGEAKMRFGSMSAESAMSGMAMTAGSLVRMKQESQ